MTLALCVTCRSTPCRCRALRPLDLVFDSAQRGKTITLGPCDIDKERMLFAFDPCPLARGETLGIVFGLREEGCIPPLEPEVLPGSGLVLPYVQAKISWGLGGACRFMACVDVLRGIVIPVVAETVDVCVVYRRFIASVTPEDVDPSSCCAIFSVSAGVGYSTRGGDCARFTEPIFVPANSSKLIEIPPFASRATVIPGNGATSIAWSLVGDCNARASSEILTIPVMDHSPDGSVIWPGARQVLVQNGGNTDATVFVVFTLSLC